MEDHIGPVIYMIITSLELMSLLLSFTVTLDGLCPGSAESVMLHLDQVWSSSTYVGNFIARQNDIKYGATYVQQ